MVRVFRFVVRERMRVYRKRYYPEVRCIQGSDWFKERGLWQDNSYEPRPGDIIFFDWDDESGQDGLPDHVGIVQKVEDGRVYTVEGNSGDECRQNSYPVGYYEIYGYGVPAY